MNILPDGTVIQSTLSLMNPRAVNESYFKDFGLKEGIVTAVYYPDEEDNISKKWIEYDVSVLERRSDGSTTSVQYLRCQVVDLFGSLHNYTTYTYAAPAKQEDKIYKGGARVLVLVLNGNSGYGNCVIVGGLPSSDIAGNEALRPAPKKEDGQFYTFSFNGIDININKDGEYSLTFQSPMGENGKRVNEKASGVNFQINKDGVVSITTPDKQKLIIDRVNQSITVGDEESKIIIDTKNKIMTLESNGKITSKAKEEVNVSADKDIKLQSKAKIQAEADQDITIDTKANMQTKVGANWQINVSGNVQLKAGGLLQLEGGAIAQLKGAMTKLGEGTVLAAGVGISQAFGVNGGGPMVSNIITGSATTFIGS